MLKIAVSGLAFAVCISGSLVRAEEFPTHPLKLVVPYGPGAMNDTLGRLVGEGLGKRLGQPVIVENKPGAGGQVGISYAAKSTPDGYTLLLAETGGLSILPALKKTPPYDVSTNFAYLSRLAVTPFVLVARPDLPFKSYEDLVSYASLHPDELRHGHTGQGSITDLVAEIMAERSNIKLIQVPYKSMANVVNDVAAGHIDIALVAPSTIAPFVKSGKVRALVVVSDSRHRLLPEVPSYSELGYTPIDGQGWYGVVAPAGLPEEIRKRLEREIQALAADPAFKQQLEDKGLISAPLDASAFRKLVIADNQKWKALGEAKKISFD